MPNPRKYFPNGRVIAITLSLESGLLLLANPLSRQVVESCLARAQSLYPVRICALVVESTHIHLVLVVFNPADIPDFVRYFKTETATRFNILMGWKKRTVWCDGYDSPVVLTPVRALLFISYLYANPPKDNLIPTIDEYPGFSTWKMFRKNETRKIYKFVRRPAYKEITPDAHHLAAYTREAERLCRSSKKTHEFRLEPNAWLEAYGITDPAVQKEWNDRLIERVRAIESREEERRKFTGKRVMGAERLLKQPMTLNYRPDRSGRRMWCLSEKRSTRVAFINFLKELRHEAREVYKRWHRGDFSVPYPLGLFPPSMPKLAEPFFAE